MNTPGKEWLEDNWNPETLPYDNEWVAVSDDGVVAHDPSFDVVVAELRKNQLDVQDVTFSYVNFGVWQ
jgi:hypothetical protein